jgi:hypothetical protein
VYQAIVDTTLNAVTKSLSSVQKPFLKKAPQEKVTNLHNDERTFATPETWNLNFLQSGEKSLTPLC